MTRHILRLAFALAVVAPGAGCFTGPSASTFLPVASGYGVQLMVQGEKGKLHGELLEVREHHLVVWDGCRMHLVPFSLIHDSGFKQIAPRWILGVPTPQEREELRMLSRFPVGIPEGAMKALLQCSGASEPTIADI